MRVLVEVSMNVRSALGVVLASILPVLCAQQPDAPVALPSTQQPAATPSPAIQMQGTSPTAPNGQAAAPPTATNTIRTNARLVVLDAVVVDKKGNAITNLSRDQFHIQEDGADQTMLNFTPPGRYTPTPDLTIDSTADLDRLAPRAPVNIICLDEFNTLFEDMAFARYSLQRWLKSQPDKLDTPTMLVSVSLEKFEVLHDYTQNKAEILSALDHHFVAYPWQAHNYAWVSERMSTAFFTLRRVAEASAGHVGHKNMIWIGRGFPNVNWVRFASVDQDRVHNAMQQTVNELRDARVTLYTIDPAGLMVDPGRYGSEAAIYDPFGGEPNFQKIATATGGRNLYGRNDVDAEIGTSIRDGASFYTLTYRPTDSQRDITHFRKISVSVVGQPDLKVVTRQGYFDSRAPARLTADGQMNKRMELEMAGAETSRMVYDAVPISVAESTQIPGKYVVHVDANGVTWTYATDTAPRQARLVLSVTTFDKKDKPLELKTMVINVSAPTTVPATGHLDRAVAIDYILASNPKAVRARFVVRNNANGRMGSADVDLLHPPQAASTAPAAGSPTP